MDKSAPARNIRKRLGQLTNYFYPSSIGWEAFIRLLALDVEFLAVRADPTIGRKEELRNTTKSF